MLVSFVLKEGFLRSAVFPSCSKRGGPVSLLAFAPLLPAGAPSPFLKAGSCEATPTGREKQPFLFRFQEGVASQGPLQGGVPSPSGRKREGSEARREEGKAKQPSSPFPLPEGGR
jgi:hypothetical protein